ncbi:MAG: acyl-ACP thioesterase domain-containing protein, partial [Bacilli bacterium]
MICQKKYTIKASDSDSNQRLKTSVMLKLFQEISISHIIKLGIGREKTFDKGLLWIIISSHFQIRRLPKYDETIII